MSEKRFIDGGEECIEDQFLIDTLTDKYYWIDNGLDDIVNMLNALHEENEQLKEKNEQLFAKLKFTCEQIDYSERLREMIK